MLFWELWLFSDADGKQDFPEMRGRHVHYDAACQQAKLLQEHFPKLKMDVVPAAVTGYSLT